MKLWKNRQLTKTSHKVIKPMVVFTRVHSCAQRNF